MSSGIYWGELACLAEGFEHVRTVGFEPAVVTIRVHRDQVLDWLIRSDPKKFAALKDGTPPLPKLAALLNFSKPARFTPLAALPTKADLVVEETRRDFRYPGCRTADMFIHAARVAERSGKHQVLDLTLVDVRDFWRDHGLLLRDFNVVGGVSPGGTLLYTRASLKPDLDLWTPREVAQACLDRLPGGGTIVRFPGGFTKEDTPEVFGNGGSPLEALRGLCDRLELIYNRNLDGSASFYLPGDGLVGEGITTGGAPLRQHVLQTGKGVWEGQIPDETNTYSQRVSTDAPDEVAIVCPSPVYTIQVDNCPWWVRLETPDPLGGPARATDYEVTDALLDRLGPQPAEGEKAVQPGRREGLESWRLYKLPVLGGEWKGPFGAVPADLTLELQGELFRRVKLPNEWAHLAPILARAEHDDFGGRLPPLVEAFGYVAKEFEITKEEAEQQGLTPDQRARADLELAELESQIAKIRDRIRVRDFVAKDFAESFKEVSAQIPALRQLSERWAREQRPPNAAEIVTTLKSIPETTELLIKMAEANNRFAAELLGLDVEALDPEGRTLDQLKAAERDLKAKRVDALTRARPEQALAEELHALVAAYELKVRTVGVDLSIAFDIEKKEAEIDSLLRARQRKTQRTVTERRHMNVPRRPVPYRIEGEWIVLEEPSVWLMDDGVADPRETFVRPMPVRITFGSWCRPRPEGVDLPEGNAVSLNPLVDATVKRLASDPALKRFQVDLGGLQPREPVGGPLILTFSRDDRASGAAVVSDHPFRVDATKDPRFQVFYEMPTSVQKAGFDNRDQVLELATTAARRLMAQQIRESGTLTVLGPRPVDCSSRVTGVRWASDADGCVDTTLSFESETEPFPGLERALPDRARGPVVVGFDPRSPEDVA